MSTDNPVFPKVSEWAKFLRKKFQSPLFHIRQQTSCETQVDINFCQGYKYRISTGLFSEMLEKIRPLRGVRRDNVDK